MGKKVKKVLKAWWDAYVKFYEPMYKAGVNPFMV